MRISSGIIIRFNRSVLLCHPSKQSFDNTYTFPKGGVEKTDADLKATAFRECKEEIGIDVSKKKILKEFVIDYTKKNSNTITKTVHLFLVDIKSLDEILLSSTTVPKKQLQLSEVDWAGFLNVEEAKAKIFWRFKPLLSEIFL